MMNELHKCYPLESSPKLLKEKEKKASEINTTGSMPVCTFQFILTRTREDAKSKKKNTVRVDENMGTAALQNAAILRYVKNVDQSNLKPNSQILVL